MKKPIKSRRVLKNRTKILWKFFKVLILVFKFFDFIIRFFDNDS